LCSTLSCLKPISIASGGRKAAINTLGNGLLASYIKPFAIADGGRTEFSTREIPDIIMDKQQLHLITISLAMFVYSHYWEW